MPGSKVGKEFPKMQFDDEFKKQDRRGAAAAGAKCSKTEETQLKYKLELPGVFLCIKFNENGHTLSPLPLSGHFCITEQN